MGRIVFILFVAFVVWLLFRMVRSWRRPDDSAADPATAEKEPRRVETVSQCAWCGVHAPPQDAVALPDGRIYCCDAHREAARQAASIDRISS